MKVEYWLDGLPKARTSQKHSGETNRTVIAFDYDGLRRLVKQRATALGDGVDGTIQSMQYAYDPLGRRTNVTSFGSNDCTGTAANEVVYEFNDLGLPTAEYQAHAGAKDGNTPYVGYAFDDTAAAVRNECRVILRNPHPLEHF